MELQFIKIVENSIILSVSRPVSIQSSVQSLLSVVCANHLTLWQVHDSLLKEFIIGRETDHKLWHEEFVVVANFGSFLRLIIIFNCKQVTEGMFNMN